jgi:hypothetical protein
MDHSRRGQARISPCPKVNYGASPNCRGKPSDPCATGPCCRQYHFGRVLVAAMVHTGVSSRAWSPSWLLAWSPGRSQCTLQTVHAASHPPLPITMHRHNGVSGPRRAEASPASPQLPGGTAMRPTQQRRGLATPSACTDQRRQPAHSLGDRSSRALLYLRRLTPASVGRESPAKSLKPNIT